VSMSSFCSVNVDDVITAISHLPDKSSAADPLPVSVMKMVAPELAPFLTELFNRSMSAGHFPATFKEAFITPAIKKPGLDAMDAQSYRPISNLTVVSKLLERIVARQLKSYLQSFDLLPSLQSGFRPGHSTETAVLRVMSDLLEAVDSGDVAVLVLLDLSAAFDTVDHSILGRRLQVTFGLDGPVLAWFHSYLHGRSQCVRRGMYKSLFVQLLCGVPQGSVLGPILFIMYTADLIALVEQHGFCPHLYADDTQIYGSTRPPAIHDFQQRLSACIDDVHSWMSSNRLQLNTNKTELLWCATARRQHQLPRSAFRIGPHDIIPSKTVRDLGIFIDADLSMRSHVQRTVAGCFAVLRQLRSVRRSVPSSVFQTLIVSLVLTKLDFGNATLSGLPTNLLNRLQSVLNAAARSIAGLRRSDHVTDTLASFHWLRAPERINFKLAVLVYRALHGTAPRYLSDFLRRVADLPSRCRLRSATSNQLDVRPSRLVTVGDRSFGSVGPKLWNSLPDDITSASSLPVFRKKLKTHLFQQSYPDIIL